MGLLKQFVADTYLSVPGILLHTRDRGITRYQCEVCLDLIWQVLQHASMFWQYRAHVRFLYVAWHASKGFQV